MEEVLPDLKVDVSYTAARYTDWGTLIPWEPVMPADPVVGPSVPAVVPVGVAVAKSESIVSY